jgi:hypothetical protein
MTFDAALRIPLSEMNRRQINEARGIIGIRKLEMRRAAKNVNQIIDQLRPLNYRIDAINVEDEIRQRGNSR